MHDILERQVARYLGPDALEKAPKEVISLLNAISETYEHADDDRKLIERSLDISSRELNEYISLLAATIESTEDGLLVINQNGMITTFNSRFIEIWHIPQEVIDTKRDEDALTFVLSQLNEPEVFLSKVRYLYSHPEETSFDILHFKDGSVVERYSRPQQIKGAITGRVWSFRDVTERVKADENLRVRTEELERVNKLMIGREMKMVELKTKLEQCLKKPDDAGSAGAGPGADQDAG